MMLNILERLDKTLDSFTGCRTPFTIQFGGAEINFKIVNAESISSTEHTPDTVSVMHIELWNPRIQKTTHVEVSMRTRLSSFLPFADMMTSIFIDGVSKNNLLREIKTTLSLPDEITRMTLKNFRICEVPFPIDEDENAKLYVSKKENGIDPLLRSSSSKIDQAKLQKISLTRNGTTEVFNLLHCITGNINVAAKGILIKILLIDHEIEDTRYNNKELNVLYQYSESGTDENIILKDLISLLKEEENERSFTYRIGGLVDFGHRDITFHVTELGHIQKQMDEISEIEKLNLTPIFIPFRIGRTQI
jgi:hypothetical protein